MTHALPEDRDQANKPSTAEEMSDTENGAEGIDDLMMY